MSQQEDNRQVPRDHNLNELFEMVRVVVKEMTELKMQHADLSGKFRAHMTNEEYHFANTNRELSRLADTVESLTALHKAFPEVEGAPDLEGHRTHHEQLMLDAVERAKTVDRIKAKALDMLVSGVIIGTFVVITIGAQAWLKTWLAQ